MAVDEMAVEARYSGLPEMPRRPVFDANSHKTAAEWAAAELKKDVTGCNMVVAHMGTEVSVGARERGRVIDVNNALDGEGPMSTERSGSLPLGALIDMCFSGSHTMSEIMEKINGSGGLVAHLGTKSLREVEARIASGDAHASVVFEAMALQIGKEIGRCAAVLKGEVDAIVLTGELAESDRLCERIAAMVSFIAPTMRYPERRG